MGVEKKVLFTASIAKHILRFHVPYLKWFKDQGYSTFVACAGEEEIPYCDVKYLVPFVRSPFSFRHVAAFRKLKEIIDRETFQLIHCHTPMASVVTRLAAIEARRKGVKVLYSAHGFHFYKGAPWVNWISYYPIEVALARFTDAVITINKEDFGIVQKHPFTPVDTFLIKGVGVDCDRFSKVSESAKALLRQKHGYQHEDFILIYVAEFIKRKNHEFVIRSLPFLKDIIPNIKIVFPGRGVLLEKMIALAHELAVERHVIFPGFRNDVNELMQLSNIGISASRQEGLGLNLAEEMACGLPLVASQDRGHRELVTHGVNGFLFEQNNRSQFVDFVYILYRDLKLRMQFSDVSYEKSRQFSLSDSLEAMAKIYQRYNQ